MREIKFRAWDKKKKTMILFGSALTSFTSGFWGDGVDNYKIQFEREGETNGYNHDDFNEYAAVDLMQYTGLKDKNGVEIYEGDVMAWDNSEGDQEIYNIHYNTKRCAFEMKSIKNLYTDPRIDIRCYVIGNIYENPELITKR